MALMTFEQLDRSIDADSDSDDELAEQAHMYRSKSFYFIGTNHCICFYFVFMGVFLGTIKAHFTPITIISDDRESHQITHLPTQSHLRDGQPQHRQHPILTTPTTLSSCRATQALRYVQASAVSSFHTRPWQQQQQR